MKLSKFSRPGFINFHKTLLLLINGIISKQYNKIAK